MTLRESTLIDRIEAANAGLLARFGTLVTIPPGDDMAGLRLRRRDLLVAVDQVIMGRHVRPGTPWSLIGRKAVCRNLSDVAAMAARPLACVASAALPPSMSMDAAAELFESLRATAERYDCPLVGGDTGTLPDDSAPLVVAVTILADCPEGVVAPLRRSGAMVGDGIFVTGTLGGAWRAPSAGGEPADSCGGRDGIGRHLTFEPRLAEAVDLARMLGLRLHAMIDISDGLGSDARHLATASRVRVAIEAERIPRSPGCTWQEALSDGEDYELCFAAEGPVPTSVRGVAVTRVGEVVAAETSSSGGALEVRLDGRRAEPAHLGWEHGREREVGTR